MTEGRSPWAWHQRLSGAQGPPGQGQLGFLCFSSRSRLITLAQTEAWLFSMLSPDPGHTCYMFSPDPGHTDLWSHSEPHPSQKLTQILFTVLILTPGSSLSFLTANVTEPKRSE